jgi:NADH:ubiquinone oxidoreductase subunit 2 (subunit N)
MQTPYMVMSLQANEGCRRDKILAAIFSYITLNGFIVLPGTFTSLENLSSLSENKKGKVIQAAVQNIPLLPMAGICCFVGTMGSYWLWRKWRKNYIWLVAHILL